MNSNAKSNPSNPTSSSSSEVNSKSSELTLPPGWTKGFSKSQQRTYYCHAASKHTQWHFPTATEAQDPRLAKKRIQQAQTFASTDSRAEADAEDEASNLCKTKSLGRNRIQDSNKGVRNLSHSDSSLGEIMGALPKKVENRTSHGQQAQKRPRLTSGHDDELIHEFNTGLIGEKSVGGDDGHTRDATAVFSSASNTGRSAAKASDADATCVAIIVPYRDIHAAQNRAKHLKQFVPHMHDFFTKWKREHWLTIICTLWNNRMHFDIGRKNKCRGKSSGYFYFSRCIIGNVW